VSVGARRGPIRGSTAARGSAASIDRRCEPSRSRSTPPLRDPVPHGAVRGTPTSAAEPTPAARRGGATGPMGRRADGPTGSMPPFRGSPRRHGCRAASLLADRDGSLPSRRRERRSIRPRRAHSSESGRSLFRYRAVVPSRDRKPLAYSAPRMPFTRKKSRGGKTIRNKQNSRTYSNRRQQTGLSWSIT
jgi:hypothetical protein